MNTAEDFKNARKVLNMTQKELANALGIARNYVYLIESGKMPVSKKLDSALNSLLSRENLTREEKSPQIQETIEQKIDTIIKMLERIAIALETK
jgi:transcriptional regulator with XRE-family HTH domain